MTFLQFIFLCLVTNYATIIGHMIINHATGDKRHLTLREMFESGQLASDVPIREQIREMESETASESIEIYALDDEYDIVDIISARAKLRAKNEKLREVVLEVN